jgi:hypothetical protein
MIYLKSDFTDNFQNLCLVFKLIEYYLNEDQTIEEYIVVYKKIYSSQTEIQEGDTSTKLIKIGTSQNFKESSKTEFESAIENKKKVIIE